MIIVAKKERIVNFLRRRRRRRCSPVYIGIVYLRMYRAVCAASVRSDAASLVCVREHRARARSLSLSRRQTIDRFS